ncbi:MAG: PilZ domain-containing protein, partial [Pseudomonadota bacterium]
RRRHPRVATNAPARLHLADGTSREARLLDCSSGGTQVAIVGSPVAAGPVTSGQRARLEVLAKPDATSGYHFDVDIRSTRGLGNNTRLGLAFDDLSATDRRALATIMYRNSGVLDALRSRRHKQVSVTSGTLTALVWSLRHILRGFACAFGHLRTGGRSIGASAHPDPSQVTTPFAPQAQ